MTGTRAMLGRFKSRLQRGTRAALPERASREASTDVGQEDGGAAGVRPENMVWIFGPGRTGTTWVAAMIEELRNQTVWFEPRVGDVFNPHRLERHGGDQFLLSQHYKDVWLGSIRNFILDGADARFPRVTGQENYLMIKDPGGSGGAEWVMEALPESRMVLLIRDPRDVAASWLDAASKGGWQNERKKEDRRKEALADENPNAFVGRQARTYLRNVGSAKKAYDAHQGPKAVVRYEELRSDTLGTMRRMYSELGIPVDEGELARAIEKHSWENIPEEEKGEGKFYRKASPGSWQEDLTPRQVEIVERVTGPLIEEFYPA